MNFIRTGVPRGIEEEEMIGKPFESFLCEGRGIRDQPYNARVNALLAAVTEPMLSSKLKNEKVSGGSVIAGMGTGSMASDQ